MYVMKINIHFCAHNLRATYLPTGISDLLFLALLQSGNNNTRRAAFESKIVVRKVCSGFPTIYAVCERQLISGVALLDDLLPYEVENGLVA